MRRLPITIALCLGLTAAAAPAAAPAAEPVTVMPLGDSITAGTAPGGYRKPMADALAPDAVTTVGTQRDKSMPPAQQPHEGHGGWRLDQLDDNLLGENNVDATAHGGHWLRGTPGRPTVHPQYVTLMAGINDLNQFIGHDKSSPMADRSDAIAAALQTRLAHLVATLTTELPDATVLLGGCIPYNNGLLDDHLTGATPANRKRWAQLDHVTPEQELGVNHWVIGFNRWIRDTYVPSQTAAGKHVAYVDLYAAFILPDGTVRGWDNKPPQNTAGPAAYGDFGLHPNPFGYGLIGHAFADAIRAAKTPSTAH